MCTLHTCFWTFGTDLYAQSALIDKISASELTRKFIESALLVGEEKEEEGRGKKRGRGGGKEVGEKFSSFSSVTPLTQMGSSSLF